MKNIINTAAQPFGLLHVLVLMAFSLSTANTNAMVAMADAELSEIDGQALFWSDMIKGNELAGANSYSTPFNFYRVGLDGELALNTNIAKAQLGCGGVNDYLGASAGCDIDIDYATLMGREGTSPGNPLSAFVLKRPYIEFAIKNDDNPTKREVVGLKIGAQSADGAITAGRRYGGTSSANQINQENMDSSTCAGSSTGSTALGCHSGINSVSGFLGAEMSLTMDLNVNVTVDLGIFGTLKLPITATGCTGRTQNTDDACGTSTADALFIDLAGTRMQNMGLTAAKLQANNLGVAGINLGSGILGNLVQGVVNDLIGGLSASLKADLRLVHKLTFENTGDFFISFQREPVAYPRYSKRTPIADLQGATATDICATSQATARCSSAYAVPANTGWWLNAPSVKLLDVYNPNAQLPDVPLAQATTLLSAPGYLINQAEFNLTPSKNCYGSTRFC
ncbi:MAG: hypothetical protein REI12_02500 [Pedobacter sp.]|nr:hypothetical protein [Pedobacter sp.]